MRDWIYRVTRLVVSSDTAKWCGLPYPNHKKGCPNYGKAERCPPQAPKVNEFFDINRPLYIVHSEFDLTGHSETMKFKHPEWSDRQCRCVLYWQSRSRRHLNTRIGLAHFELGTNLHTTCPEAMGVNVYVTARISGLKLERIRRLSTCRHVALLGWGNHSTKPHEPAEGVTEGGG